jgi:hypothetical protein
MIDLSSLIFAHRDKLGPLKLKLHPDKPGGDAEAFGELDTYLKFLSTYIPNWADLAESGQDVEAMHNGTYVWDPNRRLNSLRGKYLTLHDIILGMHAEFADAEHLLKSFDSDHEFKPFPRFQMDANCSCHAFSMEQLDDHLRALSTDLGYAKTSMQKNSGFVGFQLYPDRIPRLESCVAIDFDWKSWLCQKLPSDSKAKSVVSWLLAPNSMTEMMWKSRKPARSRLEAYEFSQIPRDEEDSPKQKCVCKRFTKKVETWIEVSKSHESEECEQQVGPALDAVEEQTAKEPTSEELRPNEMPTETTTGALSDASSASELPTAQEQTIIVDGQLSTTARISTEKLSKVKTKHNKRHPQNLSEKSIVKRACTVQVFKDAQKLRLQILIGEFKVWMQSERRYSANTCKRYVSPLQNFYAVHFGYDADIWLAKSNDLTAYAKAHVKKDHNQTSAAWGAFRDFLVDKQKTEPK